MQRHTLGAAARAFLRALICIAILVIPTSGTTLSGVESSNLKFKYYFTDSFDLASATYVAVNVTKSLTVTSSESTLSKALVSITANLDDSDVLSFTDGFCYDTTCSITSSYSSLTGILTLTGSDSPSNYQKALRGVQFKSASYDLPDTKGADTTSKTLSSTRTIAFTAYDADGTTTSNTVTRSVKISAAAKAYSDSKTYVTIGGSR